MTTFLRVFATEARKLRRSLAVTMVLAGACFTPAAVLAVRLLHAETLPRLYANPAFWTTYWNSVWESVAVFLLPMGVILVTALAAQVEHRNGTWKQVATLPVASSTIFAAKFAIVALLVALFLIVFVVAGTLGALVPAWWFADVPQPSSVSLASPLQDAARHFVLVLPILAAQFALSLRFANVMVPVGIGFITWVAALALLSWKYAWLVPYGHGIQYYMATQPSPKVGIDITRLHESALAMAGIFVVAGLLVFVHRRVKG
ncbi:ABC transporter permease [Dokdonella sp. MW10]|uniref:ABC transporter permease n=1 Tax=Dokdonella sp. MW10 TaxID=2992926 RepID=UPI003F806E54